MDAGTPVSKILAMNIDADVIQADWLRIIARMAVIRAMHPDQTEAEVRVVAKRGHRASLSRRGSYFRR